MQDNKQFIAAQTYLKGSVLAGLEDIYQKEDTNLLDAQNMSHHTKLKLISTILLLLEKENIKANSMLDVCCGDGKLTEALGLIFNDSQGFDACENAIAQNKKSSHSPERYFVGDALFPENYLKQSYDLIIIHQAHMLKRPVLGSVPQKEYDEFYNQFLKKYLCFLNPGGMIIVSHGINGPEHIKPENLSPDLEVTLFSLKLPALVSLLPHRLKNLAFKIDQWIARLFKRSVTSFYLKK